MPLLVTRCLHRSALRSNTYSSSCSGKLVCCREPLIQLRLMCSPACLPACRLLGVVFRHCVLFPIRLTLLLSSHLIFFLIFFTVKGLWPSGPTKLAVEQRLIRFLCGMYVASWTGVIQFHGPRPMPEAGHVWVANHTSMIDYVILSSYTAFAVIMQLHPGWVGFLQTAVLDSLGCLWFNRTQVGSGGRKASQSGVLTLSVHSPVMFCTQVCSASFAIALFISPDLPDRPFRSYRMVCIAASGVARTCC